MPFHNAPLIDVRPSGLDATTELALAAVGLCSCAPFLCLHAWYTLRDYRRRGRRVGRVGASD